MVRLLIVTALVSLGVAHLAVAQSLGDVAKKEEERRKVVKTTGKTYTNDQLKSEPQPSASPSPSPAPPSSATSSTPASESKPGQAASEKSDKDKAVPDKNDEKAWRKRIADARESLQRSQMYGDALQSQLNALQTDFVNRDDPAQRQQIAQNRDKVTAELAKTKKEVAEQTKAISDLQDEARRAGVPAGWVR
jgi:hypothetical protein